MTPPIVTLVSDKYLWALRPFAHQFNKYWSKDLEVKIVGFSLPPFSLPENFSFVSLGKMEDYPAEKWSDALIKFLTSEFLSPHFILMLEDYWLARPVDTRAIDLLGEYMSSHPEVLRVDITADRLYAGGMEDYGYCEYLDLIRSSPQSQYHMSLQAGIWNRDLMLRYLRRGENPWEFELNGTSRLSGDPQVLVLGTRQRPVRYAIALWSNRDYIEWSPILGSDISELRELGLLKEGL